MSFLSDIFGGGDSNSTTSTTDAAQTDRRITNDSGLVLQGDNNKFDSSTHLQVADSSNRSTDNRVNVTDTSNRSTWADNRVNVSDTSNRSQTDNSVVNVTDGGIVKSAMDTVTAGQGAIAKGFTDLVKGSTDIFTTLSNNDSKNFGKLTDTSNNEFQGLLGASTSQNAAALSAGQSMLNNAFAGFNSLMGATGKLMDTTASATKAQNESVQTAYQTATAEKSGTVDNKTILVLGLAAMAAGLVYIFKKG